MTQRDTRDLTITRLFNAPEFEFPTDREIVITRIFDAPRELVFKASTNPDLIPKWWGPKRFTTTVESMDVLPGGGWRFIQRDQDGNEYAFHGVYQEIVLPEREIHTGVRGQDETDSHRFIPENRRS